MASECSDVTDLTTPVAVTGLEIQIPVGSSSLAIPCWKSSFRPLTVIYVEQIPDTGAAFEVVKVSDFDGEFLGAMPKATAKALRMKGCSCY